MTRTHITVPTAAEHPVATADVTVGDGAVHVEFAVETGHVPATSRHDLVEAVFDLPDLSDGTAVEVSLPLGDADLLFGVGAHCTQLHTHAAGTTCLVDAIVSADAPARD